MTHTETRPRFTLHELGSSLALQGHGSASPAMHRIDPESAGTPGEGFSAFAPDRWLEGALSRLDQLGALGPGWDGGEAKMVSPSVLEAVRLFVNSQVIRDAKFKPELVPTFDGGIQLEWHTEAVDLIIECQPSGSVTYYSSDIESDEVLEGSLPEGAARLEPVFTKLGWHRPSPSSAGNSPR